MKCFCVDASFLIAVYDPADGKHEAAFELFGLLFDESRASLVAPWPILYETVSTRLVRRRDSIEELSRHLRLLDREGRLSFLDDSAYRERELRAVFEELERGPHYRHLSLVDRVVRRVLADDSLAIHGVVTYNSRDFVDVCHARGCEIIP